MQLRRTLVIATIWVGSLLGAVAWAQTGGGGAGTVELPQRGVNVLRTGDAYGRVITGDDFGIQRVAGPSDRDKVLGRLMVRIDGEWREVQFPVTFVR